MQNQVRSRIALAAFGLAILAGGAFFARVSTAAVSEVETRAIAGNFPHMHIEDGLAAIDEHGRVDSLQGTEQAAFRYVASMRLVPPGKYQAVIIATDDNETHRKKSELVIAACDAKGHWHPASAAAIAARLQH
jgi:hypothetical protein